MSNTAVVRRDTQGGISCVVRLRGNDKDKRLGRIQVERKGLRQGRRSKKRAGDPVNKGTTWLRPRRVVRRALLADRSMARQRVVFRTASPLPISADFPAPSWPASCKAPLVPAPLDRGCA